MRRGIWTLARQLGGSASVLALVLGASLAPATAAETPVASQQLAGQYDEGIERNKYALRYFTQVFDGSQDFSHTQIVGFSRMRKGNLSWSVLDFGNGSVVIESPGMVAASRFTNTTSAEVGVLYNYDDKTIQGTSSIANYHNRFVRPHLDRAPALGHDVKWSAEVPLGDFNVPGVTGQKVAITLSREYFSYQGKDLVLIHYKVPAFRYQAGDGTTVVQWGQGISLTDPGFGEIYLNATLQRAVSEEAGGDPRPYRYARMIVRANADGSSAVDVNAIPQLARYNDQFFSKEAMQVVPFNEGTIADQRPMVLAANIDVMALSLGENSANDAGNAAAANNANRGNEKPNTWDENLNAAAGYADKGVGITGAITGNMQQIDFIEISIEDLTADLQLTTQRTKNAAAAFDSADLAYKAAMKKSGAMTPVMADHTQALYDNAKKSADGYLAEINNLKSQLNQYDAEIATEMWKDNPVFLDNLEKEAQVLQTELNTATRNLDNARGTMQSAIDDGDYILKLSPELKLAQARRIEAAKDLANMEGELAALGQRSLQIESKVKLLPAGKISELLNKFGNSPAGKVLTGVSHGLNVATTGQAIYNTGSALGNDQSTGELTLTRSYGGVWPMASLALDLAGLAGNAFSGNVAGTFSDATAIASGSIGDVIISFKGMQDASKASSEAFNALQDTRNRRSQQLREKYGTSEEIALMKAEFERDLAALKQEIGGLPEELEAAEQNAEEMRLSILEQRKKAREEVQRQEQERAQAQRQAEADEAARRQKLKEEQEYLDGANDRLKDEMEPDYPTAPPRDPDARPPKMDTETDPAYSELSPEVLADIERAQKLAEEKAALDKLQARILAERKAREEANKDFPDRPVITSEGTAELETSTLETSDFDSKPVTFTPVTFTPVTFDRDRDLFDEDGNLRRIGPDDFVLTPFDPPEISQFPPTDPDDLDGYPGTGQYPAFAFDEMSGTVETSLDRWAEWLEGQDVRLLERLALQAGYPNLASALADAENIIRQSQDSGYRRWAMTAPSCSGSVGCGPQYLERWAMKRSIVALGDILAQSRGVFSTGGLTDIGISGFNLQYALRDHGVQDGDIVNINITQFGRTLLQTDNHLLLNNGTDFSTNLRPGVAQMVITAVNEGSLSPNTAAININNVVRGTGSQTYSLNTGETAVLRIEANSQPGN